jgi:hypothetical protein
MGLNMLRLSMLAHARGVAAMTAAYGAAHQM